MKNLANCKPSEFFKQTMKIKKSVEKWVKAIDLIAIRNKKPTLKIILPAMSVEEKAQVLAENKRLISEQSLKNLSELFENAFEKNPEKTLEVLALMCFVEPEDADNYEISEYLAAFNEMMGNKAVMDFLLFLGALDQKNTSALRKASDLT